MATVIQVPSFNDTDAYNVTDNFKDIYDSITHCIRKDDLDNRRWLSILMILTMRWWWCNKNNC